MLYMSERNLPLQSQELSQEAGDWQLIADEVIAEATETFSNDPTTPKEKRELSHEEREEMRWLKRLSEFSGEPEGVAGSDGYIHGY